MKTAAILLALVAISLVSAQTVWVASPWEHVLKSSAPGTAKEAVLSAAANEYEPFRIIVRAGEGGLADVNLIAKDLNGPGGRIPARNVTLFREHYLNVFEPSLRSTAPVGWDPDALIPFVDPVTGEKLQGAKYQAAPCTIEANANQGYWVDVYVPAGTKAGDYRGTVTVMASGKRLADIPVKLTVWPFELPQTIAMESCFGSLGTRIAKKNGLEPNSPELAAIEDQYLDAFLAHRAVPGSLGNIWPTVNEDGTVDDSQTGERLRKLVEEQHVNALRLPFSPGDPVKCKRDLRAYANYLRGKGWLKLAYVYMRD